MFKIETVEFIREIVTNFIAFLPTIAIAGFFSAWLAKKLGDETAHQNGFLTLNPVKHIDTLGLIFMFIPPYFGFSRGVPLNPNNISGNRKNSKVFLLFSSRFLGYFFVLVLCIFIFSIFNYKIFANMPAASLLTIPKYVISIILVLKAILKISVFCVVIHFCSAFINYFSFFYRPNLEENPNYFYVLFILPLVIFWLFGPSIEYGLNLILLNIDKLFKFLLT